MAIAVLTGDIVGSKKLDQNAQQQVGAALVHATEAAAKLWGMGILPYPVAVFRGDSWQFVVTDARLALRIVIYLRAWLKAPIQDVPSLSTRVGIGIGEAAFMPSGELVGGGGEAFVLSGEALDKMPRGHLLALALSESTFSPPAAGLGPLIGLLDEISARWTEGQSRAVTGTLEGLRQREIASRWPDRPATQQAIADHLRRAGWGAVLEALEFFEGAVDGN